MPSEYDERQLLLMQKKIEIFERSELNLYHLSELIDSLEGLLWVLQDVEEQWKASFIEEWGELEILYAIMLDKETTTFTQKGRDLIGEALKNMKNIITQKLSNNVPEKL